METEYQALGQPKRKSPILKQLFVCLTACFFYLMLGLGMGLPTVAVPQLRREANSTAAVSEEMASWITSIMSFTAVPSVVILVITSHYIGRKKPWSIVSVSTFISFTILFCSKNVSHIFISQLILGFTFASQTSLSLLVMTECASPRYRGFLLALKTATFYWGVWCANAIGSFFHYKYIGLIGMCGSAYNFVSIIFLPETPFWLASQGRMDECAVAHRWLKGVDKDAEKELDALIKHQKDVIQYGPKCNSMKDHIKMYLNIVVKPEFYKPVSLAFLIIIMYNASGKLVFTVYAVEMLKKITSSQTVAYNAMLVVDGFSITGMYIGCIFIHILKRRPFLLISSGIAVFLIYLIAFYLYLVKLQLIVENNYICVTLLVLYSLAVCSGPLILSGTISNELLPLKSRSFGLLFVAVTKDLLLGSLFKFSPKLFKLLGFHGSFLFFGLAFSGCIILVYKFIPETKDKTLNEISAQFERKQILAS